MTYCKLPVGVIHRVCVLIILCLATASATAQSSLRSWGVVAFDTEGRRGQFTKVVAALDVSMVLRRDGLVFGQGANSYGAGQAPLPPSGLQFVDVATGGVFSVGLLSNGSLVSWGRYYGLFEAPPPVAPPGLHFIAVAAAGASCFALRSDGIVIAWGMNVSGECNVPALGGIATKVAAGGAHVVALLTNGTVVAWGNNLYGQLQVPQIAPGRTFVDIAACGNQTLGLLSDGTVVGWGDNSMGQGSIPLLPSGMTYVGIGCGCGHSLLRRSDGMLLAFGDNSFGQCDVPLLPPGVSFVQAVGGNNHSIALLSNGKVLAWGENSARQGTLPELALGESWVQLRVGAGFALGLDGHGRIKAFGADSGGKLSVPPLPPGRRYVTMTTGLTYSLAIRDDGVMVGWGYCYQGQLAIPPLPRGVTYTAVATDDYHTLALRSDGTAIAFGTGYGAAGTVFVPPPGKRYIAIDTARRNLLMLSDHTVQCLASGFWPPAPTLPPGVGYSHMAACDGSWDALVRTDGQMEVWGTPPNSTVWYPPPPLPPGVVYVEVAGGHVTTVARRSDGNVVVFGFAYPWNTDLVPELLPGTSYIQVEANYERLGAVVGPTSTYVSFASGCPGSRQSARLVPQDTPSIDAMQDVHVFDLPQDVALLMFGWNAPPPVSLASLGMPGCAAYVSPDVGFFLGGQNGVAQFQFFIPNAPWLIGTHFYNQAVVLDAGAGNAAGAVMSDAADGVIGRR